MKRLIDEKEWNLSDTDKRILMLAALCHDLGKATTTYFDEKEQDYKCKSHGLEGSKITRNLLYDMPVLMREEICWLVRWHMDFHHIMEKPEEQQINQIKKLSQGNSNIKKLLLLNIADAFGSKNKDNKKNLILGRLSHIQNVAKQLNCFEQPFKEVESNKDNFTMYVMVGLPGSGKDTYIKKFLPNHPCICRDDIREEIKDGNVVGRKLYLDNASENLVTNVVNRNIEKFCRSRESFVINQTSLKRKYRDEFIRLATKFAKPKVVYIYVEAQSVQECINRRGNGKWNEIINRMNNDFEFPTPNEYDELLVYKN